MEGRWERGQGEVPDALFDPQFTCKGMGRQCEPDSYQHSKHVADYRVVNRMAKAKGKAKGEEQPAVGGTVGGGACKGKPAVGGKGQFVRERGLPFESNILMWSKDGTWHYHTGKCVSLLHLFAKCGRFSTAAKLYEHFNICRPIASKRPHAWTFPVAACLPQSVSN